MTANVPKSSKVFISYSCESSQHNKRVLELANRLCNEGIDSNIDQYEDSPLDGWFYWMINQIEEADFVLIVCTEKYERRFMGKVEAGKGLGARWEGAIITQELYYQKASNKCIPIVFSPDDSNYIPVILKSFTYYDLSEAGNYDKLYARLTGQKLISKPPIGRLKPLEPKYSSSVPTVQNQEVELAENKQKPMIGELKTIGEEDKPIEIPKVFTSPSTGMEFVLIPAGRFTMGSPDDEVVRYDSEGPLHKVTIKNPFYLGKYPVTQKQWIAVMGDNHSRFKGEDLPVEKVSWYDIQEFIDKLNEMEGTDKYRLPSEAEWEYACRADTQTRYSFGNDESMLGDYAWYYQNSRDKTHPVGQKKPNPWGLYDMHGNVLEWVQDEWHGNYKDAPSNGDAWEDGVASGRVVRGGVWYNPSRACYSAFRLGIKTGTRDIGLGFRLLREYTASEITPEVTEKAKSATTESSIVSKTSPQITNIQKSSFQQIKYKSSAWENKKYNVIKIVGEKYVFLKPYSQNKFAKLVKDSGDKITLKTDEKTDLGQGYALEAKYVDVDSKKVWFEFTKDGEYVDDQIVSTDGTDKTWTCELDKIQGEDNVPVLKVHVNQVFQGAVDIIAQIDGLWLIDFEDAFTIKPGDKIDGYEIMEIADKYISYKLLD